MEILPFIIFGSVALVVALAGGNSWKEVADKLGLEHSRFLNSSMSGAIDGFQVNVTQHKNYIEIRIHDESIRNSITLSKEGLFSGFLRGPDIEIGCPSFDLDTFVLSHSRNSAAEVSALLDYKTREVVSRYVVRAGVKVSDGTMTHTKTNSVTDVPQIIDGLLELANHLNMTAAEIPSRLAANAINDPVSSVRLQNLSLLLARYPHTDEAAETSSALLADRNETIRLAAAMFAGPDALDIVKEIAQSAQAVIDLRIKAHEYLAKMAEPEDLIEIAKALLAEENQQLQRMGIRSLGRLEHRSSLDAIVALIDAADVPTVLEIIKTIPNLADSAAEPTLIRLLSDPNSRVKIATIEALGKVGTITAVEPLHLLTTRRKFKRSAREAIDSIQSRLGSVEAGRLSLAPVVDPSGALSLAGGEEIAGGLSLGEQKTT